MKRYIQSSTIIQKFNKDPFKAFTEFLRQSNSVTGFDEQGETFSVWCNCTAIQLRDEFITYVGDPDKVKVESGYDEEIDLSYSLVVIRPTSDRWRKIEFEFTDVDDMYDDDEDVWVAIQDVF